MKQNILKPSMACGVWGLLQIYSFPLLGYSIEFMLSQTIIHLCYLV